MKPEDLIAKAEYKQHPYGESWQLFDEAAFTELIDNVDRRGLDKEIILFQDMVLDGWHRYLACLATKTTPKFVPFKGTDLEAAELVHASGIRRHSSADKRYASLLTLFKACPAFKQKYEQLRAKGEQQQKAGTPLGTGDQRVDVLKAKADAAGVSKSTAKKVERLKKAKPSVVAKIAAGRTTANKELRKLARKRKKSGRKDKQRHARPEKAPATKKSAAVTCTLRLNVLPADGKAAEEVVNNLRIGKAELWISGLHIWLRSAKPVPLAPGAPFPKGCLGEVTGIEGRAFKLDDGHDQ